MKPNWEMRILLVDNNRISLKLIEKSILVHNAQSVVHSANNLVDLFKELHLFNPDIVVTARSSKGFEAYEVLRIVRQRNEYLPVFIVTPEEKKLDDAFLLQQGAREILTYSNLSLLPQKLRSAFEQNALELVMKS
jgi:CheY-like chemotaxis protein